MTRGQVPGPSDRRLAAPPTEEGNPGLVQRCRKLPDLEARVALPPEQLGRLPQARGGREAVGTSPAQDRPRSGRGAAWSPVPGGGCCPGQSQAPDSRRKLRGRRSPATILLDPPPRAGEGRP